MLKRAHVYIEGRVQGVFFRDSTRTRAEELGVNGWVKNLADGRVEAVFEADEAALDEMLSFVQVGPEHSRVTDVTVVSDEELERLSGFRILMTVLLAMALVFTTASQLHADEKPDDVSASEASHECTGFWYRAKKDEVPVYDEPALTGKVVYRLSKGNEVCYVGEEKKFVIIDWSSSGLEGATEAHPERLAYVRRVDLWKSRKMGPLRINQPASFFERAKQYITYMLHGGIPEDPLLPYRPLIGPYKPPISEPKDKAKDKDSASEK